MLVIKLILEKKNYYKLCEIIVISNYYKYFNIKNTNPINKASLFEPEDHHHLMMKKLFKQQQDHLTEKEAHHAVNNGQLLQKLSKVKTKLTGYSNDHIKTPTGMNI